MTDPEAIEQRGQIKVRRGKPDYCDSCCCLAQDGIYVHDDGNDSHAYFCVLCATRIGAAAKQLKG